MADKKITPKAAGTEKAAGKTSAAGVTKKTLKPTRKVTAKLSRKNTN